MIGTIERRAFGEQMTPEERAIAGLIAGFGTVGHAALGAVGLLLLYTLTAVGL